jgi:hypothetical protein
MNAHAYTLLAIVILLFPMLYFLIASLAFFLRKMSDPVVTWMLRGLFNAYFIALVACGGIGVLAFLAAGRPAVATGLGLLGGCALGARAWFLARLDAAVARRDAGDVAAARRLRRLHVGGIAYNATQAACVIAAIPRIFPGL